jgi:hypothetical protein
MSAPTDLYVSRLAAAIVPALVAGVLAGIDARMGATPIVAAPVKAAPVAAPVVAAKPNDYVKKADRLAGAGHTCTCGRTDLRYTPKHGSYHNDPLGKRHDVA